MTKKEKKQLRLPWIVDRVDFKCRIRDNGGISVCVMSGTVSPIEDNKARAAFAVRAVNSHHAMVEAAQAVLDAVTKDGPKSSNGAFAALQKLEAALKLATQ